MIVQWTNVSREDRYNTEYEDGPWIPPGNIYSQNVYDKNFVEEYFSELGAYIRDLALIKATHQSMINKTQLHFLQMNNIMQQTDQWTDKTIDVRHLNELYKSTIQMILPSFYNILYDNNIQNKFKKDHQTISNAFMDGHPSPMEHYTLLQTVFEHDFKQSTINAVRQAQTQWIKMLQDASHNKKNFRIFDMDQQWIKKLYQDTIIKPGEAPHDSISTLNGLSQS